MFLKMLIKLKTISLSSICKKFKPSVNHHTMSLGQNIKLKMLLPNKNQLYWITNQTQFKFSSKNLLTEGIKKLTTEIMTFHITVHQAKRPRSRLIWENFWTTIPKLSMAEADKMSCLNLLNLSVIYSMQILGTNWEMLDRLMRLHLCHSNPNNMVEICLYHMMIETDKHLIWQTMILSLNNILIITNSPVLKLTW